MPVDKFGRQKRELTNETTTTTKVFLTQLSDTFLRRDGQNTATGTINMTGNTFKNVSKPVHNYDTANKIYVDENAGISKTGDTMSGNLNMNNFRLIGLPASLPQTGSDAVSWSHAVQLVKDSEVNCVKKSGDTMTGNLILSIDGDRDRIFGCANLDFEKSFTVMLGTTTNRLYLKFSRKPIVLYTENGFLIKVDTEDICQLGTSDNPPEIIIYKDVRMNMNRLTNLPPPILPHEAATKLYVDAIPRKILHGYVPNLRSSGNEKNDKFGFIVTASSYLNNGFHPINAFNGLYKPRGNGGRWATNGETNNFWIQIKCPDFVRLWRIALRGADGNRQGIYKWKLGGSTDGDIFTDLYEAPNPTSIGPDIQYFEIDTAEKFNIFRLFCLEAAGKNPGLSYMQLYTYSD